MPKNTLRPLFCKLEIIFVPTYIQAGLYKRIKTLITNQSNKHVMINVIQTPTIFAWWELHLINIDLLGAT